MRFLLQLGFYQLTMTWAWQFKPHGPHQQLYLVSNDTMLAVSKSNKCETYQQKITTPLTNESHIY